MTRKKLIVIGNGMAGSRFVAEMCARGGAEKYEITVFGDERGGAYNRILLSDVLNGSKTAQSVETHSPEWFAARGVCLRYGKRVVRINRETREIHTHDGDSLFYDELVLATGSRAAIPPVSGLNDADGTRKTGVFALRTLEDCDRIASFATKARRAVVIGGGLLGLEAARGLLQHGAEVHLVHRSHVLMSAQLDEAASQILQRQIEALGITVHLGKNTREIVGEGAVSAVKFADETLLPCDMIVFATGISPNIELAKNADLEVENAVVVDDELRAAANVYAIGECAQHRGQTYGLVAPAWEQARVLAQNFCGQNAKYEGTKTGVKLKVMGVELAAMGETREREGDEVIEYREARRGRYKKIIIRDGAVAGAILLGDTRKSASLTQLFERQTPLPTERETLLFDIGKSAGSDAKSLPDDATVCNCNAVCAGAIRERIKAGDDLEALAKNTRAGTGCGSCKSLVREFLAA